MMVNYDMAKKKLQKNKDACLSESPYTGIHHVANIAC